MAAPASVNAIQSVGPAPFQNMKNPAAQKNSPLHTSSLHKRLMRNDVPLYGMNRRPKTTATAPAQNIYRYIMVLSILSNGMAVPVITNNSPMIVAHMAGVRSDDLESMFCNVLYISVFIDL